MSNPRLLPLLHPLTHLGGPRGRDPPGAHTHMPARRILYSRIWDGDASQKQ